LRLALTSSLMVARRANYKKRVWAPLRCESSTRTTKELLLLLGLVFHSQRSPNTEEVLPENGSIAVMLTYCHRGISRIGKRAPICRCKQHKRVRFSTNGPC
jgi:hypothetical protein